MPGRGWECTPAHGPAFRFVDGPVMSVRDAAAEDPDLLQALFLF